MSGCQVHPGMRYTWEGGTSFSEDPTENPEALGDSRATDARCLGRPVTLWSRTQASPCPWTYPFARVGAEPLLCETARVWKLICYSSE